MPDSVVQMANVFDRIIQTLNKTVYCKIVDKSYDVSISKKESKEICSGCRNLSDCEEGQKITKEE